MIPHPLLSQLKAFERRCHRLGVKHHLPSERFREAARLIATTTLLTVHEALDGCEVQTKHTGQPEIELTATEHRALALHRSIVAIIESRHE